VRAVSINMAPQTNPFRRLLKNPYIVSSAIGGVVIPIIDNVLGLNPSRPFFYALFASVFVDAVGPKPILFGSLVSLSEFFSFPPISTLFNLFGTWQVLLLFPPMGKYICGLETDGGVKQSIARIEIQLILYCVPILAIRLVTFLLPVRRIIIMVLISLAEAFATCPIDARDPVTAIILRCAIQLPRILNIYDLYIRGLFLHVCDALIAPFDRWEINIARRRWNQNQKHSPLKPYKYHEPGESRHIRLLQLGRKSLFSKPSCKLIEVPLDNAPDFEAISYTWGGKDPDIPVEVDGHQMLVTSAVDELLFYWRSTFTSNLFWIDAICIIQKDTDEKKHQIAMMADIYRRASRVIVWLGAAESRKDTHLVRKMISTLYYPEYFNSTNALLQYLFDNEEEAFVAMGKLLRHPWFERIWIDQEVAVGETVHVIYHGTCTQWEVLAAVIKRLCSDGDLKRRLQYYNSPKATGSGTSTSDRKGGQSPTGPTISTVSIIEQARASQVASKASIRLSMKKNTIDCLSVILPITSIFKSTNPRDKVFAVLGIVRDSHKMPFKPDYNVDVGKLLLKTTAFVLASEEWFFMFSFTGLGYDSNSHLTPSRCIATLPSWVPDYTSDRQAGHRPPKLASVLLRDPAGKVTFTSDDRVIQLQVFAFDFIQHMGPRSKSRNSSDYILNPNFQTETFTAQSDHYRTIPGEGLQDSWYFDSRHLPGKY
jgi:hypothetical protein